jgi:hypothetical protein
MNTSGTLAVVVLAFALIALVPIATIYSMNQLFAMGWVVDFPTWLSVFWLQMIVAGGAAASKRNKK